MRYFGGWDLQLQPGGPVVPDYEKTCFQLGQCETMRDVYDNMELMIRPISYSEDEAVGDFELWPHPLITSFSEQQVLLIVAALGGIDELVHAGEYCLEDGEADEDDDDGECGPKIVDLSEFGVGEADMEVE